MRYTVERDFEHAGLRCVVIMTEMGHRCGYVGVPEDHMLYGVDYNQKTVALSLAKIADQPIGKRGIIPLLCMDNTSKYISPDVYFNVHGGVTYAGGGKGSKYPVESDLWWFGYDCDHPGDGKDLSVVSDALRELEIRFPTYGIIRSTEYCIDECKSLAEQLVDI